MKRRKNIQPYKILLLICGFYSITVLARYNLDPLGIDYLIRLHFESWILNDECPDIVAQSICMQMTLWILDDCLLKLKVTAFLYLESSLGFDLTHHRICQ